MISAASALSGFDLPARRSKNRSQSQKCVLRVFLRASAPPRLRVPQPPPDPESRQHKIFFLPPNPIHPNHLSAPPPAPPPPPPPASLPPPPTPSHANIKYSSSPLPPSTQITYPPHHPPPPRQ